ncbi:MAG: hypothetical protein F4W91_24340 [Gemmatimonadetes bacterium]|nr:hypothetical protein [Gemmatimonadota bacterium]
MKREIGKLTVLMTVPILLSLVWNIHATDKAEDKGNNRPAPSHIRVKTVQLDTISISVPHTIHPDSIRRRVRISISERYQSHDKFNTRDLLLRPADKAIYTTSDLLLRPGDNINSIFISHHPTRVQRRVYPGTSHTPYRLTPVAHHSHGSATSEGRKEP